MSAGRAGRVCAHSGYSVDAANITALQNLEARYAMTWDQGDAAGWAAVFTDEGVFEIAAVGDRPSQRVVGSEELRDFCTQFTTTTLGVHLPSLPYLEIDGDTATGHVNFHFVAVGRPGAAHTLSRTATGHYEVRYVRTDHGWRMQHRVERVLESSRAEFFTYQ